MASEQNLEQLEDKKNSAVIDRAIVGGVAGYPSLKKGVKIWLFPNNLETQTLQVKVYNSSN